MTMDESSLFRSGSAEDPDIEEALGGAKNHPIDVLDLAPVARQARERYKQVSDRGKDWDDETLSKLQVVARFNLGRTTFDRDAGKDVYVFDQAGKGPMEPLKGKASEPDSVVARVSLYASMQTHTHSSGREVAGFVERTPYTEVVIDRSAALKLRSSKEMSLSKFLLSRSAEHKAAVISRARAMAALVAKARSKSRSIKRERENVRSAASERGLEQDSSMKL